MKKFLFFYYYLCLPDILFSCKKNENPAVKNENSAVPDATQIINGLAVNTAAPSNTVKIMFIHH